MKSRAKDLRDLGYSTQSLDEDLAFVAQRHKEPSVVPSDADKADDFSEELEKDLGDLGYSTQSLDADLAFVAQRHKEPSVVPSDADKADDFSEELEKDLGDLGYSTQSLDADLAFVAHRLVGRYADDIIEDMGKQLGDDWGNTTQWKALLGNLASPAHYQESLGLEKKGNKVVRVLSSSGVASYSDATLQDLMTKHPFHPTPFLPHIPIDHHHLIASTTVVLDRIKSFPRGTSCGRDGLRAQHLMDYLSGAAVAISDELASSITQVVNLFLAGNYPMMLGEYIASAPFTPLVKPGGGIRPIAVGTVWRRLVSKVSAIMIGHSLDGYLDGLQFGVGVSGGSEAIFHYVNRLIEFCGDDVGLSMLLVGFKNAFNLVDREVMLREVHLRCLAISRWIKDSFSLSLHAWYLDDGTIVGDTLVVGKVLKLIMEDGPGCGLHLNVDKTEVFWPKEDPRRRLAGIFPPNIDRPLHGVKLLGGPASVDFDFYNELVMKLVAKTIVLMDAIAKINDPQCELLLLRSCTGISRLYFTMRTCPPCVFESAQRSFDVALRSSLERIVTASGLGFGDWQWRVSTLPFAFGGLGVYSASDVLNYVFLVSRLLCVGLQTKLLRHTGIVASGPIFDDALSMFNTSMETDLFCNPSKITAPKLMKKMADIYFTRVTKNAESAFSLSPTTLTAL
ncbi:hypothetical protein Tco_0523216 [Tanacetum coccineum]